MAHFSVITTVVVVSILIAHSLCFRVEPEHEFESEVKLEARQVADNVFRAQDEQHTTAAPFPSRIRDTVLNGLRDFGNGVRQVPARVSQCFQNVTRCAQTILRRNTTENAVVHN